MAFELNPLALLNADLLRAIVAAPGDATPTQLAEAIGRDPSNTRRALKSLTEAGLICESEGDRALTTAGDDQLAAIARAINPTSGLGVTEAYIDDLVPDPDQPRKDFTSAEAVAKLEELRDSLIARGRILQPIVVRALADEPGRFIITDGERRWRAAGMAMDAGEWSHTERLPITIQETDGKETKLSQLTANMVRADMTPIEECEAFADLIDNHAMTTAEIAREIGKTQKLVQNRLRLRQLSAEARDRMALPEDHPDHLGYKAALQSLMTPRADMAPPTGEESDTRSGESGSPAEPPLTGAEARPAPPAFDTTLSDIEALLLIEIADKADRDPDPDLGSEMWTRVHAPEAMTGPARTLMSRGLVGFRQRGLNILIRPYPFSTPYGEWLDDLGFTAHRADCLFEARAKVHGTGKALDLAQSGLYATSWLNAPEEGATETTASDAAFDAAEAAHVARMEGHLAALEDDQPALIEESAEERQARQDAERERQADARARNAADLYARQIGDWMSFARARGARDYLNPFLDAHRHHPALTPEQMAVALITAIVGGKVGEAGALLTTLQMRVGAMGSARTLEQMPEALIHQVVTEARA